MQHALECVSGESLEFIGGFTPENIKYSPVHIEQLFRGLRFVDKKSSRHMAPNLLNNRECFIIDFKLCVFHHQDAPLKLLDLSTAFCEALKNIQAWLILQF